MEVHLGRTQVEQKATDKVKQKKKVGNNHLVIGYEYKQ